MGFHRVLTTALGIRTQIAGVAEHFGQRNQCIDLNGTGAGFLTLNLTTRELRSPITVPVYSSGTDNGNFMIGSIRIGCACFIASLKAIEPAILNAISEESTS